MYSVVCFVGFLFGIFCIATACEQNIIVEKNFSIACNGSDTFRNECCCFVYKRFKGSWSRSGSYLTDYLTTLRDWKCIQFREECKTPIYDYTPFTRLVYEDFCNRKALFSKCTRKLHNVAKKYRFTDFTSADYGNDDEVQLSEAKWENLTASLSPRKMKLEDLIEPCVQVALFDRPEGGVGRFHEVVQPYMVFCDFTWAGYDIDTTMERGVSPWTSWSIRCRASIVICMVVEACLGCAIIIANSIVISVYLTTRKLKNSQSIFKISIATGDILSGLVVLPNAIILQYLMYISPRYMGGIKQANMAEDGNLVRRHPGGTVRSIVPTPYIKFIGFFTMFSLTVSVYSLLAASLDRFWAIFRPLKYDKTKATRFAKLACLSVWVFATLFACTPYMIEILSYKIILAMMVTTMGLEATILLAVILGIPLIALCGVNCGTFQSAKRHAKVRQRLKNSNSSINEDSMEKRLRKVLGLMVGVFSICIFPLFFLIAIVSFFDNLHFSNPKKLDPNASVIYNSVLYCAVCLFLSNSLWNCLIYSSRGVEFRRAAKSLRVVKISSTVVSTVYNSMRRLSEVPAMYYRRKSNASSVDTTTSSNLSRSTKLASIDASYSADTSNEARVGSYSSVTDAKGTKLFHSTERKVEKKSKASKSEIGQDECATNDSTFGSFAINAGTDRLCLSVMENIEEENEILKK